MSESDPLKGLKRAMNQTTFRKVIFSEKQKDKILTLTGNDLEEENIENLILKALEPSGKSGYLIYKHLQQSSVQEGLKEQEGRLYILLHRLEQKRMIGSTWLEDEDPPTKVYYLETKGRKQLEAWYKARNRNVKTSLKLDLEGGLS